MKKNLWIVLAIGLAVACTQQKTKTTASSQDIKMDSVGFVVSKQGIKVAISTDFPAEGEALQQGVARFITAQMALEDSFKVSISNNGQEWIRLLAEAKYNDLKGLLDEGGEDTDRQDEEPTTTFTAAFKCVYETDDYLSMQGAWDSFVKGTPHPNSCICGITLHKGDGKPLGRSELLKNADDKAFKLQLKEGIKKWLSDITETDVTTDNQMKELLGDDIDSDNMPLPEAAPYLVKDGVALPYAGDELLPHEPALIIIPLNAR